ncbi:MAG: cupredoxin domain-containing protein [Nitrososphaera sp.]|uniref:cupredoxin domain-containing protein n=1 Tax=Nitrososphaera sp. TaxID=1971748 RepID=UPI003D6DECF8
MTDWDLLTPGIGLTTIGIAGVGISLSGIAKTFIDGMHAVSLLTMFIGMIFLASGLFKDGFPSSGRAKSATFITLGFLVTFGVAAAVTVSIQVTTIFAYIGLMTIIGIPAAVLAVVSYRKPQYLKAMGVIFIAASAVAGITFYAFGLVTPKPPVEEAPAETPAEAPAETPAAPANTVKATILAGASSQENPDYEPDPVTAAVGDSIEWTNEDNAIHTVTHKVTDDPLFDSDLINAGKTWTLDTSKLAEGDYEYFCELHPFMTAMLTLQAAGTSAPAAETEGAPAEGNATQGSATPGNATEGTATGENATSSGNNAPADLVTAVSIPQGASVPTNGKFYAPEVAETVVGGMVTWTNDDTAAHTVTSGDGETAEADGTFDSKIMGPKKTFSFVFEEVGDYDYFCQLHPFMTGKVTVS